MPLPRARKRPAELSRVELDAIEEQLEQLDRAEQDAARPRAPKPEPEQLSLFEPPEPRGALLCALARSQLDDERARAHATVRRSLELHGSTIPAAAALNVSERWIQTLIKHHPALCQGLTLRKPGRPPRTNDHDDPSRLDARELD